MTHMPGTRAKLTRVVRDNECRRASEWLARLGFSLFALGHEVCADPPAAQEQIVPSLALGHDQAAAAYHQDVNLMDVVGKGDRLR